MKISLVSPVYNESNEIIRFVEASDKVLSSITQDYELVLVNDNSTDDTLTILKQLKSKFEKLRIINLIKNTGQHIATTIGLKSCLGDYIFIMDSDLQVDPKYIAEFYARGIDDNDWEIISSNRENRSKNFIRSIGSRLMSALLKMMSKSPIKDIGSTFKLIKRSALDKLLTNDILIQNLPILMMNLNLRIIELPIKYNIDQNRKSHYRINQLVQILLLALLNFSTGTSTLVFLLFTGFSLLFTSALFTIGIVVIGIIDQSQLPTNLLILFLVLFLAGLQFVLMSILAFKLERVNKNLGFRQTVGQYIDNEF